MGNMVEIGVKLIKAVEKIALGYLVLKIVDKVTGKDYDMTGSYKNWKLSLSKPRKDKS